MAIAYRVKCEQECVMYVEEFNNEGERAAAFKIALVCSPETTKTCSGQSKIMMWLSGRQLKIKRQKVFLA